MYHSRRKSESWALAKSGSAGAMATAWKARSQAAYQGYSHLSGIEMMSSLNRCLQREIRREMVEKFVGFVDALVKNGVDCSGSEHRRIFAREAEVEDIPLAGR